MNAAHEEAPVMEQSHGDGMLHLAHKVEEHHLRPLPEAEAPDLQPFPGSILLGLGLGTVIGGALGWIFSLLLLNGIIVLPGSEGLFSMFPYAFQVFWIGMGAALGLAIGGIGTILSFSADSHDRVKKHSQEQHEPAHQDGGRENE